MITPPAVIPEMVQAQAAPGAVKPGSRWLAHRNASSPKIAMWMSQKTGAGQVEQPAQGADLTLGRRAAVRSRRTGTVDTS